MHYKSLNIFNNLYHSVLYHQFTKISSFIFTKCHNIDSRFYTWKELHWGAARL